LHALAELLFCVERPQIRSLENYRQRKEEANAGARRNDAQIRQHGLLGGQSNF
jgi:hypothetical protein